MSPRLTMPQRTEEGRGMTIKSKLPSAEYGFGWDRIFGPNIDPFEAKAADWNGRIEAIVVEMMQDRTPAGVPYPINPFRIVAAVNDAINAMRVMRQSGSYFITGGEDAGADK